MKSPQTFKDKPWNQRFQKLGDEAEGIFENWAAHNQIGFHRSGLNRPPFNMGKLPKMVCYTPDYLTADGYIEVQGFGADQQIKLKEDKLDALSGWDMIFDTYMFLWDNVNRRTAQLRVSWFAYTRPVSTGTYPEGKAYSIWTPDQITNWEPYGAN